MWAGWWPWDAGALRESQGDQAQLMVADSLMAWRPFTSSSKAQMPLLVLQKGWMSLKWMETDIAGGVVEGNWALLLATDLLWGFKDFATSCLAMISACCCDSLGQTVLLRAWPPPPALLLSKAPWLMLSPVPTGEHTAVPQLCLHTLGALAGSSSHAANEQPHSPHHFWG